MNTNAAHTVAAANIFLIFIYVLRCSVDLYLLSEPWLLVRPAGPKVISCGSEVPVSRAAPGSSLLGETDEPEPPPGAGDPSGTDHQAGDHDVVAQHRAGCGASEHRDQDPEGER